MKHTRIEEEKAVVELMIRLYCRKYEGHDELCPNCKELLDYAHSRLDRCRFGEHKPTCKKCPVHCYRPEMKEPAFMMILTAVGNMAYKRADVIYVVPISCLKV